jgi:hypothetical protein
MIRAAFFAGGLGCSLATGFLFSPGGFPEA